MIKSTIPLQTRSHKLLPYLLVLTAFVFVFQIFYLIMSQNSLFMLNAILRRVISVPFFVWFEIMGYWLLQVVLYFLFTLIIWLLARLFSGLTCLTSNQTWGFGVFLWFLGYAGLLFGNALLYPNDFFAHMILMYFSVSVVQFLLIKILLVFGIIILLSCADLIRRLFKYKKCFVFMLILFSVLFYFSYGVNKSKKFLGVNTKPNVFIIGIDALRPDRIHYYGYVKNQTPFLDQFLKRSTNFTNSITPLARTSVAWSSLLLGQYPKHDNIRFNLTRINHTDLNQSLANILKQQGYYTVFATDSTRFDFIDQRFGFDQVIAPKDDVNNFLMSLVFGMPLANLISNTYVGELIYPNVYANRDLETVYKPKVFINEVKTKLPYLEKKPLFLAIHFTLPHFPYNWASLKIRSKDSNAYLYDKAVKKADEQTQQLMFFLQKQGALKNAIVIILSDHGEGLGLPNDRLLHKSKYIKGADSHKNIFQIMPALEAKPWNKNNELLDVSAGHGTDILSLSQYQTLLAFRCFHYCVNEPANNSSLVSLVDIKSTVLNLLGISYEPKDGVSLVSYLRGKNISDHRLIFAETGFTPTALKSDKVSIQNTVLESANIFEIDKNTHKVVMKPEAQKRLLLVKQRAVFYKNWVLTLYVGKDNSLFPILVNRKTGDWTDDLNIPFARKSPAKMMLQAIKNFYGKEVIQHLV